MNRNQMEDWKKEYDGIPVPESAGFRARLGIKKAKQELYQNRITKILRNTGTAAAASLVVLMVAVNTNDALAPLIRIRPTVTKPRSRFQRWKWSRAGTAASTPRFKKTTN